jgi:hypothetical protein
MAEKVYEVGAGLSSVSSFPDQAHTATYLRRVKWALFQEGKRHFHSSHVHDRFQEDDVLLGSAIFIVGISQTHSRLFLFEDPLTVRQSFSLGPHRNSLESLSDPSFQRIQALRTNNDQLHPPRTILFFTPLDQLLPRIPALTPWLVPQRLSRPGSKLGVRMPRRTQVFLELEETPNVRLKVFRVFGSDGVDFALDARGVKEGFGEEACETVECAKESVGRDFESVLRDVSRGYLDSL